MTAIAPSPTITANSSQQPPRADYGPYGTVPREVQDAPGAPEFFVPSSDYMPAYFYQHEYYNQPGIGARPLADYAPVGYESREGEEGQAPGVPEYTPIPAPVPVTPEERQKFVTRGLFPGSFLVPGTNTSFRLRGFVRLTGLYDFDPIGSRDDFVTNTIPVPQQHGENANVAARYSRFALESWTPTPLFDWNVHTFIEGDFFNGPAQAVGGGGNPFRLRFAFVDFGYFRLGQQNSVFMDGNAFPSTVDFAGPRGLVNQRRPGVRATIPLNDLLFVAIGVEQPFSDITTNGQGTNVQDVPDFAGHLRYETDYGHAQLSTLLREVGFRPLD
ncbi:MAG: DcaP family trimeric outer membrane transporter, partial [Candidatus Acidiferrum sp.]